MMRFTPRLLLALVLLQLWGCSFDRKLTMKCKGDCTMDVNVHNEIDELPKEKK